ncbi:uncharacterized protein K02A2.6-like [Pseudonaja textilis]|uniref:uncharacterized protein K02A2.6-like n=1 Tax=Pseudonaja textilis TaxID=8673 RepID=UPI000EA9B926|nr:uncharacterized protein K02A2.6-like [Pseudonaja textilis]
MYQTATCSNALEGLPEKLSQLSIGSIGWHQTSSQAVVLSANFHVSCPEIYSGSSTSEAQHGTKSLQEGPSYFIDSLASQPATASISLVASWPTMEPTQASKTCQPDRAAPFIASMAGPVVVEQIYACCQLIQGLTGSKDVKDVDPQATPLHLKPRRVPFAIRPKLDAELDKLLKQGVLEPMLHTFEPGTIFAKLDMSQAYQQFPVDEQTAELQTIVTHRGAFKCRRLQFGVSVAPGIFQIDASGIHPVESKVKAIHEAPIPTNKTELQAFLGLLNFYASFLPHKASVAEPLHRLLDKDSPWHWGPKETHAFKSVKSLLTSEAVLVQFDQRLPLVLAADASPFGIGAVLSHRLPNGSEAPIAFFSRTLSPTERNYSQIDKEALAAVAAVKKFHEFLFGHHFELVTDHKPLLGLLSGDKQTPQVLSPRMTRWTLFLAAYSFKLVHRPGKNLSHADALSRCPLPVPVEDPAPIHAIFEVNELKLPVTAEDIAAHSKKDKIIAQVLDWVGRGWPETQCTTDFVPFKTRQQELSKLQGCLLWGTRVVIPASLRVPILKVLHEGHPGIIRMKALAHSYVWWPGMDAQIANWVSSCQPCQQTRAAPPASSPTRWESANAPWSRLHVDLAGPVHGRTFLVVVDSYSKWIDVALLPTTTTQAIVKALTRLFVTHGLPDTLVSDNGPQFTSCEFSMYTANLGIRHVLTAPFHPASNGMAERAVRSAKEALARFGQEDWHSKLSRFLLSQHTTPCTTTNKSPAELLMGRRLRTTLDRLHPHYCPDTPLGSDSLVRDFTPQDLVYARNYAGDPLWVPGQVVSVTGPRSYRILLEDGRLWRRHVDQLRRWRKGATDTNPCQPASANDTSPVPDADPLRNLAFPDEQEDWRENTTHSLLVSMSLREV